jgi:hypothetical protein
MMKSKDIFRDELKNLQVFLIAHTLTGTYNNLRNAKDYQHH